MELSTLHFTNKEFISRLRAVKKYLAGSGESARYLYSDFFVHPSCYDPEHEWIHPSKVPHNLESNLIAEVNDLRDDVPKGDCNFLMALNCRDPIAYCKQVNPSMGLIIPIVFFPYRNTTDPVKYVACWIGTLHHAPRICWLNCISSTWNFEVLPAYMDLA